MLDTDFRIDLLVKKLEDKNVSDIVIAYIALQFQAGLRISDLLNINYSNVSSNLDVVIKQGKGSESLIISPIFKRDIWRKIRENKLSLPGNYSRFWFYKFYRKIGLVYQNGTGRNDSVTHSARKIRAKQLYDLDGDIEVAKLALGHKSKKSTKYYVDEKFRKSTLDRGISNNASGEVSNIVLQKNGIMRISRIYNKKK